MELKIETQFGVATVNVPREKALEIIKCAFELAAEPKEAVIPLKRMERILGGIVIQTDEEKIVEDEDMKQSEKHTRKDSLFGENWKNNIENSDPEQKEGYKGFLYVKCQFCGKTKDFCAKETITEAKCLCGEKIPLKNLRPMYVKCDCGKDFRYFTNMTDDRFTCKCINCSSRVKIRMNTRGTAYVTDCRKPAKTPFARNYGGRF